MQAVIMAGGIGTRLKPITSSIPKPCVPILGRPAMEYSTALLRAHGIKECAVTTRYLSERLQSYIGEESSGVTLRYVREEKPLGSAGGVKAAEHILRESAEKDFIVISGDAVTDFDLTRAVAFHREKNSDFTILLSRAEEPLGYGVILCDAFSGRVERFIEKPEWCGVFSDTVNTGIYIVKKHVLDMIPREAFADFSADILPALFASGAAIYGYESGGYWCDVGTLKAYYNCNFDALYGRFRLYPNELEPENEHSVKRFSDGSRSFFPDYANLLMRSGVRLLRPENRWKNVICGKNVTLGDVYLRDCIIHDGVVVGDGARVEGAVLCEGAVIEAGAVIPSGAVVGARAVVAGGAVLPRGARLNPDAVVRKSCASPFESISPIRLCDDGIALGALSELSPELCTRVGGALAECFKKRAAEDATESLALMSETGLDGILSAVASGCLWNGENVRVIVLKDAVKSLASFMSGKYKLYTAFLWLRDGELIISVYGCDAIPCSARDERRLCLTFDEGRGLNAPPAGANSDTRLKEAVDLKSEYIRSLSDEMREQKRGVIPDASVYVNENMTGRMLVRALERNGIICSRVRNGKGLSIFISDDGLSMEFEIDGKERIDFDLARAMIIENSIDSGEIFVPAPASELLREAASRANRRFGEYSEHSWDDKDTEARHKAALTPYLRDGAFCAAKILGLFVRVGADTGRLSEIAAKIPRYHILRRTVFLRSGKARALTELYSSLRDDERRGADITGASVTLENGVEGITAGFISPGGKRRGVVSVTAGRENVIKIVARSYSEELSRELCDFVRKKLPKDEKSTEEKTITRE